jgi:NAD(P)-dependent dehydrogenase (short-subunit alcohol dehydrogenase family)
MDQPTQELHLGRGIATAIAATDVPVIAVARTATALAELRNTNAIQGEVADASDPSVAGSLLDRYDPVALVVVAGASPLMRPLQHQSWETFSVNWQTNVLITFHWVREALLKPLRPGNRVIVISSGAALNGSPLSGGYAGAKATQRFITAYVQDEANRAGLAITFTAVLPRITRLTDLGQPAVKAYAARYGTTEEEYLQPFGEPLSPEIAGAALIELVRADAATIAPQYLLTSAGLQPLEQHAESPKERSRASAGRCATDRQRNASMYAPDGGCAHHRRLTRDRRGDRAATGGGRARCRGRVSLER